MGRRGDPAERDWSVHRGARRRVAAGVGLECAVVTGTLRVADGDAPFDRSETLSGLGLHPAHPRFIWSRISESASLVRPVGRWNEPIVIDGLLGSVAGLIESAGEDRWQLIDQDSFFDESADGDPLDEWDRHRGVDALGRQPDIGLLCAPDLDWQWQGPTWPPVEFRPRKRTSGGFEKCTSEPVAEINPAERVEIVPVRPNNGLIGFAHLFFELTRVYWNI